MIANKRKYSTIVFGLLGLTIVATMMGWAKFFRTDTRAGADADRLLVREVVASEELILALTPQLKRLSRAVMNLRLPDSQAADMFSRFVRITDLDDRQPSRLTNSHPSVGTTARTWMLDEPVEKSGKDLHLWKRLFHDSHYFDNSNFYFIRGEFRNGRFDEFHAEVGFQGLARTKRSTWMSIRTHQQVVWRRSEEKNESEWTISDWHLGDFQTMENARPLFREVLDTVIKNPDDLQRATVSRHHQILIENYFGGVPAKLPSGYRDSRFFPDSNAIHPGLAVVDIDQDGFEDLYVTVRWGKNQLWSNQGDGTFREVAAAFGLDIEGRSSCAIFADFDNDGDPDLILGRTLEQSMYLMNDGGQFVDRTQQLAGDLPFLVTSLSAADFNMDGLLDVYISTYTPIIFNERFSQERTQSTVLADEYLRKSDAQEFRSRYDKPHHRLFSEVGPPNLLLVNRGEGRFEVAAENNQMQVWRNTFQATWTDYDLDGDVDLYVANDFATDNLFRNDGRAGFVDVTEATGVDKMGFGMGASWGDYDNDGDRDLYVSNMYSKAGNRIIRQMTSIDPRFTKAVEGNFLYRNNGKRFDLVSGLRAPQLIVARAGWAWGGQFADLDNDGFLDLYVASGYYTVPEQHSTNVDL